MGKKKDPIDKFLEKRPGVFIPKEIWGIKNLSITEKVILSEIYFLDSGEGVEIPNEYFEKLFNYAIKPRQLSRVMSRMSSINLISKMAYRKKGKRGRYRAIKINIPKKKLKPINGHGLQDTLSIYRYYNNIILECPLTKGGFNGIIIKDIPSRGTSELFNYLVSKRDFVSTNIPQEMSCAKKCLEHASLKVCKQCIDSLLADSFWQNHPLFMATVLKNIPRFAKQHKKKPLVIGGKSV